jgi:hypothetical protein
MVITPATTARIKQAAMAAVRQDLLVALLDSLVKSSMGRNSTFAIKRYPFRGTVSMIRGVSAESLSVCRSLRTAVFKPSSKLTDVSVGHKRL